MISLKRAASAVAVVVLFLITCQAVAYRAQEGQQARRHFHVMITVPGKDGPGFQVPAKGPDSKQMFALIPALPAQGEAESGQRPSYIKVVPEVEGDSVRVKLFALFGKLEEGGSTEQLKNLKEELVVSLLIADGERVNVKELERFGVKQITLEVVSS